MSLPSFSTQSELFSTAGLSGSLFPKDDRYRLFAKLVYPELAAQRPTLEPCYCAANGRVAIEPVVLLGVSLLQELDGMPDRLAVEMMRYHAGWNFALNRQIGDPLFHPTTLVNFRNRLEEHDLRALGFTAIWKALEKAGLVSRRNRQRLDSTQMFGRVAQMSRLDCVRESLRLALQELEPGLGPQARPPFWATLRERYVESQTDYRTGSEVLTRKMAEAGADAWQLLGWLGTEELNPLKAKPQAQLLARVFEEQFEVQTGAAAPLTREQQVITDPAPVTNPEPPVPPGTEVCAPVPPPVEAPGQMRMEMPTTAAAEPPLPQPTAAQPVEVRPKD